MSTDRSGTDNCYMCGHRAAENWNQVWSVGTPVTYWPGDRTGPGRTSVTASPAWVLPSGAAVVEVDGYPGGIALTHIEPIKENDHD
jgi:hypothetical protein